jgi:gas vesicle protein
MSEAERRRELESLQPESTENPGVGRAVALVLAGIGIGAGLALLLTPRRGDEVRDAISRSYRKTLEGLTERAQELRERAQSLTEDLRERAPNLLPFARQRAGQRYRES